MRSHVELGHLSYLGTAPVQDHSRCGGGVMTDGTPFHLLEASVDDIHGAMRRGEITSRDLVRLYGARIAAYDKTGPKLNAVQMVNPAAEVEAERLDDAQAKSGKMGPL